MTKMRRSERLHIDIELKHADTLQYNCKILLMYHARCMGMSKIFLINIIFNKINVLYFSYYIVFYTLYSIFYHPCTNTQSLMKI